MNKKKTKKDTVSDNTLDSMDEGLFLELIKKARKHDPISLEAFIREIQQYDICDFLNPNGTLDNAPIKGDPYNFLLEATGYRVGLFNQYAAEMLKIVQNKTDDAEELEYIKQQILFRKLSDVPFTDETNDIVQYIEKIESETNNTEKVSVLPLICGSGKSSALTRLIRQTVVRVRYAQNSYKQAKEDNEKHPDVEYVPDATEQDFNGLLVITDSKERLNKLWRPDPENKNVSELDRCVSEDCGEQWVTIITEDNSQEEWKQRKTPVLCITTQRYFGWKKEEIEKHLEWEDENGVHKRPLIIFDEQPYLNEVRDISVKTINDIDTALRTCLDDECDVEKKRWCCEQWTMFRDWFFALLQHYEYDYIGADDKKLDTLYCPPQDHDITEDDDKFFAFIEDNRKKIRAKCYEAYNNLYTVKQWMNSWSIFSHRDYKTGEYSNKFLVYIDNRDKVTGLGAKVIVLDGTGNISPMYMGQEDYVDICDGTNFLRSLSYLTIQLGDLDTSKEAFRRNEIDIGKTVLAYLKQHGYEKAKTVFFTYKGKENKFQARVNGKLIPNVAHFGDIRGKNDFTSETAFAQVGINRMQPVQYLVHVLARHEDMLEDLAGREPESMYDQIQAIYQDDRYIEFMTVHVLADIDQCMFRSAIRNADNLDSVVYYIFYKQSQYPALREAIESRYKKLGAHVEPIKQNDILDAVDAGRNAWKLRQWFSKWDGKPIKQNALCLSLSMSRSSFNSALRRDKELAMIFKVLNQNAKNAGYRGAWYMSLAQQ